MQTSGRVTSVPAAFYSNDVFVIIGMCGSLRGALQKGGEQSVCVCVCRFPESLPLCSLNLVTVSMRQHMTRHRCEISSQAPKLLSNADKLSVQTQTPSAITPITCNQSRGVVMPAMAWCVDLYHAVSQRVCRLSLNVDGCWIPVHGEWLLSVLPHASTCFGAFKDTFKTRTSKITEVSVFERQTRGKLF